MKHLDLFIHGLTLFSGFMTALLGFLLYLKYRIREIRYYAVFMLTTTFTVATTMLNSYLAYNTETNGTYALGQVVGLVIFQVALFLINYSFSRFALGIIHKSFGRSNKIFLGIPGLTVLLSIATLTYVNLGPEKWRIPPITQLYFFITLAGLFLAFLIYSCRIAINLKTIRNTDLKRALKVLALFFIIYIPLQALVIIFNSPPLVIMLSRNLFYFSIHAISIIFAAKYFFIQTPSIMEPIAISETFIQKYGITPREKEVIELLLSGLSIKEISAKLDRSFKTMNNHIYNIYQKTQVSSKLELLNVIKENSY
jgi:DNA-binding CsgD family transcriptional regulator